MNDKLDIVERMAISSNRGYMGFSPEALKYQFEQMLSSTPEELVSCFNRTSRDCQIEYLGCNEYRVTVKPVKKKYAKPVNQSNKPYLQMPLNHE
ncbi:MAG: hypothetical protein PHT07_14960 [Paludibacter sp.]|nr:hypothetical protein [Paludibacter sp.]